jgi:hypothetical protein
VELLNKKPRPIRGLERITNRVERLMYYRKNSEPFLSGDLFSDKSDVSVYGPKFRRKQPSFKDVAEARVIFCPSHEVFKFFYEYKNFIHAKVIILGNSDFDFNSDPVGVPSSVRQIFATNVNFKSKLMQPIPIGIENFRLAKNGKVELFKHFSKNGTREEKILAGPFSNTHPERIRLFDNLYSSQIPKLVFEKNQVSPKKYSAISRNYKFILAPRGNGLDTHRFWETVYRGSIPIVRSSFWSQYFKDMGVPLCEIADWEDSEIKKVLNSKVESFNPKDIKPIWWKYWEEKIRGYL